MAFMAAYGSIDRLCSVRLFLQLVLMRFKQSSARLPIKKHKTIFVHTMKTGGNWNFFNFHECGYNCISCFFCNIAQKYKINSTKERQEIFRVDIELHQHGY